MLEIRHQSPGIFPVNPCPAVCGLVLGLLAFQFLSIFGEINYEIE